ncbi:MAG: DUF5711 family protein [Eubacteriales bacterium]|nr:DUF5711 family protein [Eubacteriales bacterium]
MKKRPPAVVIVLALAALALLLFVVLLLKLPRDSGQDDYYDALSARQLNKLRSYTYNETRELELCGKRILRLSSDQFVETAMDGTEVAHENLNFNEVAWAKSESRIMIGDRRGSGRSAYLFNQDGLLWESPLDGSFAAAVDGGSFIAVVDQPESGYPKLHLLNAADGVRKYTLSFAESGYIADLSFTPGQKAIDVLLLNLKSSKLKVIIKRYDFNGGQMAQFMPAEAQDFYHGLTHQGENLIIHSIDSLMAISASSGEPLWTQKYAEIIDVQALGSKLYAIVREDPASPLQLLSIAPDGSTSELLKLTSTVQISERFGHYLAIAAGRELNIIDLQSASLRQTVKLPDEAMSISYDGASTLYLLTGTAVHELPLR